MEKNNQMKTYILDTSVVVKWFSGYIEDNNDTALRLRQNILQGEYAVIVPDLLFYEFANALRYNARFHVKDVHDAVKSVADMGFHVKGIEPDTLARAIEIAYKYNVTVYDTYFFALAQIENKPMITADYRFVERMKGFKNIIKLSDFVL